MSAAQRFRVMIVDDHPIMRDGLRDALDSEEEFEVVGQAADGAEAVRSAQSLQPDVIVMDVIMPNKNGVDACREIMDQLPDTRVLILTASTEEDAIIEAVAARRATCTSTPDPRSSPMPFETSQGAVCAYRTDP